MATKPKKAQAETPNESQQQDRFYTPRYATEMLLPYIPPATRHIWEPMCGEGRMARVLAEHYEVTATELNASPSENFFSVMETMDGLYLLGHQSFIDPDCIITNPAYSIKRRVYLRCLELGRPFALLIPADWCQWIWNAIYEEGCQCLVPSDRISYFTPNLLDRIFEGEGVCYGTLEDAGVDVILKYTSAQFHSMWLTRDFDLPERFTPVEVKDEMKRRLF